MISKTTILCITILGLAVGGLQAGVVNGTANLVLGQPDFGGSSSAAVSGLHEPRCVVVDPVNNRVFVADYYNNRVLWWNNPAGLTNGKAPDGVIGQPDTASFAPNRGGAVGPNTLYHPSGLAVDSSGNLWVADKDNNRVLRFTNPPSGSADLVLGQASLADADDNGPAQNTLNEPLELCFDDAGNLWVSDFQNHRVLRFPQPFTANNQLANLVLGQKNFNLGRFNDSNGDGATDTATAATFNCPDGIFVDQAGNVWVADHLNQRVLRFGGSALSNGMNADLVIGAVDFAPHSEMAPTASLIRCAYGVWGDRHGSYWVTDTTNNRMLRFSGPLSNGMNAAQVIGQESFNGGWVNRGGAPGAGTLNYPCFVFVDAEGNLWVAEQGNNRVLKYNAMKVLSLDVTWALNTGPREFLITGEGMVAGTTFKLSKAGQPDIIGTNVVLVSENQARCTFDLTGAAGGSWDVVVENSGLSGTLPAALEVVPVKLTSAAPTRAFTTGTVDMALTGENFYAGIVPALRQAGQPDITGQFVNLISSTLVTCRFDLIDAATGFWDVTVPPANADATLENGFQVFFPSAVVRAISRDRAYRIGIDTPRGIVVVEIPAGAFAQDCVITIAEPKEMPDVDTAVFTPTDVAVEITNDKELPLLKIITISFFYNSSYVAGLDRARLVVSVHEKGISKWLQANSVAYAASNKVVAKVRSLSIFRVVQRVVKPDLSTAAVYPNPYRPGSGGPYDDTMMGRGVVFSGLTGRATIKVFTLAGEQVIEINETSGTGVYLWNTDNDKNEKAASGVYLFLISNPDDSSQKRKGTFSIIR